VIFRFPKFEAGSASETTAPCSSPGLGADSVTFRGRPLFFLGGGKAGSAGETRGPGDPDSDSCPGAGAGAGSITFRGRPLFLLGSACCSAVSGTFARYAGLPFPGFVISRFNRTEAGCMCPIPERRITARDEEVEVEVEAVRKWMVDGGWSREVVTVGGAPDHMVPSLYILYIIYNYLDENGPCERASRGACCEPAAHQAR
jgi:hypothetical protein